MVGLGQCVRSLAHHCRSTRGHGHDHGHGHDYKYDNGYERRLGFGTLSEEYVFTTFQRAFERQAQMNEQHREQRRQHRENHVYQTLFL